jgi:hypothetical protein
MIAFASELFGVAIWVVFALAIAGFATLGWWWGARLRERGRRSP